MYLWLQMDQDSLDTLMNWRPGVHKLHGVNLPKDVEYTLSLNLKYIFPITRRSKVAFDWFNELTRKSAIQAFFWLSGNNESLEDQYRNDPHGSWKSQLPFPKTGWRPPMTNDWFLEGIEDGRKCLSQALLGHSIPQPQPGQDVLRGITLSPQNLRQYLLEASLLAFISDKNLGLVVVTRDWYETEVKKFLALSVFRDFPQNFAEFHQDTCHGLDILRREYESPTGRFLSFLSDRKMDRFWNQCWTRKDIPKFHGIPKIHKDPWKLRPIVPMHSYVTSPLAIILQKMLLPVQRSFSWICESSRTLASEVAEFNKTNTTSLRLHTGDVTAMYTSIHWADFRMALQDLLRIDGRYDEETRRWILKSSEFLWNHTVFQFGSTLKQQEDGIPMGIHCGPVFANLYMAYFERYHLRYKLPQGFFYRRYIDDCFVISPSDEDVESISAPGLSIVWNHSDLGLPFLDVWFHIHPGSSEVCFRPYEKVGNHHQYLPWASSHPSSVKKGMIKGELSRIRAISYKRSYFLTWKRTFLSRLRLRGWPVRALQAWSRQVQWRNFFPSSGLEARKRGTHIIAVAEYNPVWEQISSTDIWQTMRSTWQRLGPDSQPFPPHCLIAKKRTRSLWDLLRSVNRNLLHEELEEVNVDELSDALSSLDTSMSYSPL